MRDPFLGRKLQGHEILEVVGRGGMGVVYRARHLLLDEERAIKVIHRALSADKAFVERFVREAKVLSKLKNDHLVRLHDFWEFEGALFMALEFLHGESLSQRLATRGRLGVAEAVAIARQAALGLKAAHDKGVIHRDISPDNIQLVKDEAGNELVKVMDFGIAKAPASAAAEDLTAANSFVGKLEYASPDQLGSGLLPGETIDNRADIYSLGVTLYKLVTGRLPFESQSSFGYILAHSRQPPPPPSEFAPDLPAPLEALILKALSKKRGERQASMAEFIRDLDRVPQTPIEAAYVEPQVGDTFAQKYVIEGLLGRGGMGVVYRARDTILSEPVALKLLSPRLAADAAALERLKREVVLARRVSHVNVCRIHDIGESAGVHYVSMELVAGRTLAQRLAQDGELPLQEGLGLLRDVLEALSAAHKVGIVHRDLKPDNIMIAETGRAVIMDFGLSLTEDSRRLTQAGMVVGSPLYMAPEQVSGAKVDRRCDIYAVGVMLFRICTGRLPFESPDPVEVMRGHLQSPPPRPSLYAPALPVELEALVLKALAKDPGERFETALSMAQELARQIEALASGGKRRGDSNAATIVPVERLESARRRAADKLAQAAIGAARSAFEDGDHEGAIRQLEQFSPPHESIAPVLAELQQEAGQIAQRRAQREREQQAEQQRAERAQEERRVRQAVAQARKVWVAGRPQEAIAQLQAFEPAHPAVAAALAELQAELQRREQQAQAAAELEARAAQAVAAARAQFVEEPAAALQGLAGFAPPHPLVSATLSELQAEQSRRAAAAAAAESLRRAELVVAEARARFEADPDAAIGLLQQVAPPHPLVSAALADLAAERERQQQRQRAAAELERRAAQAVAEARVLFESKPALAIARLEQFAPAHPAVAAALRELQQAERRQQQAAQELDARAALVVAAAQQAFAGDPEAALAQLAQFAPAHPAVSAARASLQARREREQAEREQADPAAILARQVDAAVAEARRVFATDPVRALAQLEGFMPPHERVAAALEELRDQAFAREQQELAAAAHERKARETATEARRLFDAGSPAAALARLRDFAPGHPLVDSAQGEIQAQIVRQEQEARARAEHERRALDAATAARRAFDAGDEAAALALLQAFTPAHGMVTIALAEIQTASVLRERRARDAVSEARRLFEAGDPMAALARLRAITPPHPLVSTALHDLQAKIAARELERSAAESAARKRPTTAVEAAPVARTQAPRTSVPAPRARRETARPALSVSWPLIGTLLLAVGLGAALIVGLIWWALQPEPSPPAPAPLPVTTLRRVAPAPSPTPSLPPTSTTTLLPNPALSPRPAASPRPSPRPATPTPAAITTPPSAAPATTLVAAWQAPGAVLAALQELSAALRFSPAKPFDPLALRRIYPALAPDSFREFASYDLRLEPLGVPVIEADKASVYCRVTRIATRPGRKPEKPQSDAQAVRLEHVAAGWIVVSMKSP